MKRLVVLFIPLVVLGSGCARAADNRDRVFGALDSLERQAREFVYTDDAGGTTTVVSGAIEDDLRYQLDETVDGTHKAAEVVVDDAKALKVDDPSIISSFTVRPALQAGGSSASTPAIPDALTQGNWVVDKLASRTLLVAGQRPSQVGVDPFFDALTITKYIRQSIKDAQTGAADPMKKFNPESEDYRPKLDPFPRPDSGVRRYDLIPTVLTPKSVNNNGVAQVRVPDNAFFRLMAVYTRDDRIIEIRERISIEIRLNDPQSNLEARLSDFVKVPDGSSLHDQAQALLPALNQQLRQQGKPPIRERDMDLKFNNVGGTESVSIPSSATAGDLSGLADYGQLLYEQN